MGPLEFVAKVATDKIRSYEVNADLTERKFEQR